MWHFLTTALEFIRKWNNAFKDFSENGFLFRILDLALAEATDGYVLMLHRLLTVICRQHSKVTHYPASRQQQSAGAKAHPTNSLSSSECLDTTRKHW